ILGDADGDGIVEHPALAFPEVACPLGVYYSYPNTRSLWTSFAAYNGKDLEPLDAENIFVDMNGNGAWDIRESPTDAWQRLGLLAEGERLTRARYVDCVTRAANKLRDDGFFSAETAVWYADQARTGSLVPEPFHAFED